jgi:hypothetical protein
MLKIHCTSKTREKDPVPGQGETNLCVIIREKARKYALERTKECAQGPRSIPLRSSRIKYTRCDDEEQHRKKIRTDYCETGL